MALPLNPEKYVLSLPAPNGETIDLAPNGVLPQWTFIIIIGDVAAGRYLDSIREIPTTDTVGVHKNRVSMYPKRVRSYVRFVCESIPNQQQIYFPDNPLFIQEAALANAISVKNDDEGNLSHEFYQHDFSGWTLDEILYYVFDCPTRTTRYTDLRREFDLAVDRDDYYTAKPALDKLKEIMCPYNTYLQCMENEIIGLRKD